MAKRIKTIEYAFQSSNTSLTAATRRDFAAITLYIPETKSRVFRSVYVQVTNRDTVTTATSQTTPIVGVKLGAASFGDTTLGNPPGNTGESGSYFYWRDATAYFNTNFGTGTSQTCQVGVNFSGTGTINISAKLIITYEYDDTGQSTLIKTVRIPLESNTIALTATLAEIGTNQIPALDTFLPETSKTYRNIFFELVFNEYTAGNVNDAALGMQVDTGTEHLTGVVESTLASSCNNIYHWDQGASPVWATNAVHAFKLRTSNVTTASLYNHVGVILYVTYEYAASSSTVINSVVLTLPIMNTTAATKEKFGVDYLINEPGTITLVQSGALVSYSLTGSSSPAIFLGGQSARTYTDSALVYCGATFLTQRADSGSAQGAAYSLVSGNNSLAWGLTGTDAISPCIFCGVLYLNYTSGKNPDGEGCHNHSLFFGIQQTQTSGTGTAPLTSARYIYIPEAVWYRNNFAIWIQANQALASTTNPGQVLFEVDNQAQELIGSGWNTALQLGWNNDGEAGWYPIICNMLHQGAGDWERWEYDPETLRRALRTPRRLRLLTYPASTRAAAYWLTYNSNVYVVSGAVSGSDGGTVRLNVYAVSGEMISSGAVTGNSAFYLPIYDPARAYFVEARESASKMGRSDNNKVS